MNMIKKSAYLLTSISIYKNVVLDDVVSAFHKLLFSTLENSETFISNWSNFYSLLSLKGYQDNFTKYVKDIILYDENIFTLEISRGNIDKINDNLLKVVENELETLLKISKITPQEIFNNYKNNEELQDIKQYLPNWSNNFEEKTTQSIIDEVINFSKENGYGIYAKYRAFIWVNNNLKPVKNPDNINISDLKEYDYQRNLVLQNTVAFLNGKTANNCLLYGDKGTGKSSTVKAILNKHYKDGLRIIEISKENLSQFPSLVDKIAEVPIKFIIFIDDLSFQYQDDKYASLKAVLEGGLAAQPKNALIYATSNRRHLVKESFSDRQGDELHRNDTIQESLSLSDRFGLSVNFSIPNKDVYINIVKTLANKKGLDIDDYLLIEKAERWALQKGGRSPRTAKQFINSLN